MYREGLAVGAISEAFPGVPVSHIHAAIVYYLLDREHIEAELDDEAALYAQLAGAHPQSTS
jgi:hypothetical protein